MNGTPWQADRSLDVDTVRDVINSQFSTLSTDAVEHLGSGFDFDAYLIDHQWAFRFPRRREYDARLLTEQALMAVIGEHSAIPVPVYQFRGRPEPAFPYHFGGYALLHGQPAREVELPDAHVTTVARQFGEFLTRLHNQDSPQIASLRLLGPDSDDDMPAQWQRETVGYMAKLQDSMPSDTYQRALALFDDPADMPVPRVGEPCLIHNDLLPEHILVDPSVGEITGIIDWSDAAIGDPMADFVGLWMWAGDRLAAETLSHYSGPADDGMFGRIRYRGICVLISELYYGIRQSNEPCIRFCQSRLDREFSGRHPA